MGGISIPMPEMSAQHVDASTPDDSHPVEPSDESTHLRPKCRQLPGFHLYHMPVFNMVLIFRALQGDICEMDIDASRWILYLVGSAVFVSNITVIFQWVLVQWPVTWYFWMEVVACAVAWPTARALLSSWLRSTLIAGIVCKYIEKSSGKLNAMWVRLVHDEIATITIGAPAHVDSADVREQSQKVKFKVCLSQQIISTYELQEDFSLRQWSESERKRKKELQEMAENVVIDDVDVTAFLALLRAKQTSKVWALIDEDGVGSDDVQMRSATQIAESPTQIAELEC